MGSDTLSLIKTTRELIAKGERSAAYEAVAAAQKALAGIDQAAPFDAAAWEEVADALGELGELLEAANLFDWIAEKKGADRRFALKAVRVLTRGKLTRDVSGTRLRQAMEARLERLPALVPPDAEMLSTLARAYSWLSGLSHADSPEGKRLQRLRCAAEDEWLKLDGTSFEPWRAAALHASYRAEASEEERLRLTRLIAGARRVLGEPRAECLAQWRALCMIYKTAGMLRDYVAAAKTCLAIGPRDWTVLAELVRLSIRIPDILSGAEVSAMVDELLARDDRKAGYWHDIADVFFAVRRSDAGMRAIERCLELEPGHAGATKLRESELQRRRLGL